MDVMFFQRLTVENPAALYRLVLTPQVRRQYNTSPDQSNPFFGFSADQT